ncbi:MAG: Do family serine endopeptidase [Oligoflexia bacterium]|nr:Do family serine endopeptidase [Oligoflexia bacterium]
MKNLQRAIQAGILLLSISLSPVVLAESAKVGNVPATTNIFVDLAKKVVPSVVNISTLSTVKSPLVQGSPDDLFRRFFEDFFRHHGGGPGGGGEDEEDQGQMPPGGKLPKAMSLGTGFIIDASGLILTNNHVVADADEIKINFTENSEEKATDGTVVGRDPEIDVALIRVKTSRTLVPMALGDSDALEVGEYVMAVGNPFGQGHSVTHGIISAKGRLAPDFPLANYLQTDAPINPGNSGGPLVNLDGEVIGINNAIEARAQGIGFAIPINPVKKVLSQLRTKGTVARGYIGVYVNDLTPEVAKSIHVSPELKAPFVINANPGEPADKAGIKNYDIIVEFNGKPIHNGTDLITAVTAAEVGKSVSVKVLRNGETKALTIKIGQRPGTEEASEEVRKKGEKRHKTKQAETGMDLDNLTPDIAHEIGMPDLNKGVVVANVTYGGPADRAGLIRGDVILEVDRKPISDVDGFYKAVKEKKSYLLRIRRADPQSGNSIYSVVVLNLSAKS